MDNCKWIVIFTDTFHNETSPDLSYPACSIVKQTREHYFENPNPVNNRNTLFTIGFSDNYKEIINHNIEKLKELYSIKKSYYLVISEQKLPFEEDKRDCIFFVSRKEIENSFELLAKLIFDKMQYNDRIVDYIEKSFSIIVNNRIIEVQKKEIEKLYNELEVASKIDSLTNVLTRKALYELLEIEKNRLIMSKSKIGTFEKKRHSDKEPHPCNLSCLMIDIDFFKKINDSYGHLTGDEVLKRVGKILTARGIFRDEDIVGRFGGEEFAVVLPGASAEDAVLPAERFRNAVKDQVFTDSEGNEFKITVSIGISVYYETDEKIDLMINRADKALYNAKENGRNKIVIYQE